MRFFQAAMLCFALSLAACGIPRPGAFYQTPAIASAPPGTVITVEPFTPAIPGAASYRVLYNSTDIHGGIIPVSGVVIIPLSPAPPGGRNLVAWAHPTTGIAPGCAPSLDSGGIGGLSLPDSIPGLATFLAAGDIVTATDYQGMGVPGMHPYLVGQAEGQDIIDSVRAARALPGANASRNFAVWGHSQGGQAALFAGEIAQSYAPELHLAGIAAAAPPTDLNGEFAEPFSGDSGRLLGAYIYTSWTATYGVPAESIIDPRAITPMRHAASKCINSLGQGIVAVRAASALDPVFIAHKPADTPPWPALFDQNSPGHAPPGAPLLIVQGAKDPTVEPHWTRSFAAKICAAHETLDYHELKGVKHLLVAYKAAPIVTAWIAARFAGTTPPNNCPTTP
jgi:alpha-beta hydrolase superfamily lysophospholipase